MAASTIHPVNEPLILKVLRVSEDELLRLQDLVDHEVPTGQGQAETTLITLQRRIHELTGEEYWPGHAARHGGQPFQG